MLLLPQAKKPFLDLGIVKAFEENGRVLSANPKRLTRTDAVTTTKRRPSSSEFASRMRKSPRKSLLVPSDGAGMGPGPLKNFEFATS